MLGSAVATAAHSMLEPAALAAWGWRIPFLAGLVLGAFGLWMRKGMVESPDFERTKEAGEIGKNPVIEALRSMPGRICHVVALVLMMGGGFYMLFVWWPTYLTKIIHPPVPHALMVNTISMLVLMALTPVAGWVSDILGRRVVLITACLGIIAFAYPLFRWTDHGVFLPALISQLVFVVLMSGLEGPMPAALVEMFPTRTRYSGIAVGYNISLALFGGTAPLVSTLIITRTGDIAAPAYYMIAMALVSFVATIRLRSSGH